MIDHREISYKATEQGSLKLHVFEQGTGQNRPAIVFFFGGGWTHGTPEQFFPQCEYLASRGMVAISAEYRIRSEHGTSPFECVADGKSAVRWVREHADDLGIDPGRIAAGGGSAGGHVAACTGIIEGFEEEDSEISSVPDAMVLFNPAVELSERALPGLNETEDDAVIGFKAQMQQISPADHVRAGLPPTIIFHGTGDQVVLFDCIERFRDAMRKAGNRCEVVAFDGKPHAFFNYGREEDNASFTATLRAADRFLASLGYLSGEPTLQEGGIWPGKKD